MTHLKRVRKALQHARNEALKLLRREDLFNRVLEAINKAGLVGEERNALALYIVATSRYLSRTINAIVKGQSSSGKNWLASRVLQLIPKADVREMTSTSDKAWNYAEDVQRQLFFPVNDDYFSRPLSL